MIQKFVHAKFCGLVAVFAIIFLTTACSIHTKYKTTEMKPHKQTKTERNKQNSDDGKTILYAEIVVHEFIDKRGNKTEIAEYYLRCSVQDYFIKFCECEVSRNEILKYYHDNRLTNPIAVEADIRNGAWDICDDSDAQSRTGKYVVIKSIVKQ